MLSTDLPPLMIARRRAQMTAFWLLLSAIVTITAGLTLSMARQPLPSLWAAVLGVAVLVPPALSAWWFEVGIRVWNKSVRLLIPMLRRYTLVVCYYVLVTAIARFGSSFDLALQPPRASNWVFRMQPSNVPDRVLASIDIRWFEELFAVSRRRGHGWVVYLLPFMMLLRVLHVDNQENATPFSTYTLY